MPDLIYITQIATTTLALGAVLAICLLFIGYLPVPRCNGDNLLIDTRRGSFCLNRTSSAVYSANLIENPDKQNIIIAQIVMFIFCIIVLCSWVIKCHLNKLKSDKSRPDRQVVLV